MIKWIKINDIENPIDELPKDEYFLATQDNTVFLAMVKINDEEEIVLIANPDLMNKASIQYIDHYAKINLPKE